jgi:hypothetical protein
MSIGEEERSMFTIARTEARRPRFLLLPALVALGLIALALLSSGPARAAACTNETLRQENSSLALPDCRAYELVTPDLNHASGGIQASGLTSTDGNTLVYQAIDAPLNAHSASVFNEVRATRDPAAGWSGASLAPPATTPPTVFQGSFTIALASDMRSTVEASDQPLSGGPVPDGGNLYVGRPDGSFRLLTQIGYPINPFLQVHTWPGVVWGNPDFSNVYIQSDPVMVPGQPGSTIYKWDEGKGLQNVGVLPDGTEVSTGLQGGNGLAAGLLQPASDDGRYVAFVTSGTLYLRVDDSHTDEIGPIDIDLNRPPPIPDQAGLTPDGSQLLFTSRAELTGDANTGPVQEGRDIYRYDTATAQLTDLTPDVDPADPRGADVQTVAGVSADGSYVYFIARGDLAPGHSAGHRSLYVWHEGQIEFLADADGIFDDSGRVRGFLVAPTGRDIALVSSDRLTGYDNTDPLTGTAHSEVFKLAVGGAGIACVSCRADGTRPTADSNLPGYHGLGPGGSIRALSDDGSRLYFESEDAVVPQASNGRRQVFQYENGQVSPLSPLDGRSDSSFVAASASGDDVFISTYDELVPNPNGGDFAIYDARVGGGYPAAAAGPRCSGAACQGPVSAPPPVSGAGSSLFNGNGNVSRRGARSAIGGMRRLSSSDRARLARGGTARLRLRVNRPGRLSVAGTATLAQGRSRVLSSSVQVGRAGAASVPLALSRSALSELGRRGSLTVRLAVRLASGRPRSGGEPPRLVSLTLKSAGSGKGGRS